MDTMLRNLLVLIISLLPLNLLSQSIHVDFPNQFDSFLPGTPITIKWSGVPESRGVRLEYTADEGITWNLITRRATGGSYDWSLPNEPGQSYRIRASLYKNVIGAATNLIRHSGWVDAAVFNTSGSRALTISDDNTCIMWDGMTGQFIRQFVGHTHDVYWAAFSPNDSIIATAGKDSTIRVWNAKTGAVLNVLRDHTHEVQTVAFSPDGRLLASASEDGTSRIWNTATWSVVKVLRVSPFGLYSIAFSPDGQRLMTAGRDTVARIFDFVQGDWRPTMVLTHRAIINSARFSPDGKHVVTGTRDNKGYVWDAKTAELEMTLSSHTSWIWRVTYDPDQTVISTAGRDADIKIWDAGTGELLQTVKGHTSDVGSAEFNVENSRMVSGANDGLGKLWTVTQELVSQDVSDDPIITRAPSLIVVQPNGGEILVPGAVSIVKWLVGDPHQTVSIDYSTDDGATWNPVADSASGLEYLWQVPRTPSPSCRARVTVKRDSLTTLAGHSEAITCTAVHPKQLLAATGASDNRAIIWDIDAAVSKYELSGHTDTILAVAFSPGGSVLATASDDHTVKIWSVGTASLVTTIPAHSKGVTALSFSGDGSMLATSSDDGSIRIWNTSSWTFQRELSGHTNAVHSLAFANNTPILASASSDLTVRLWNPQLGRMTGLLIQQTPVNSIAFGDNDSTLLVATADSVSLCMVPSLALKAAIPSPGPAITAAAFGAGDTQVVGAFATGEVAIWDVASRSIMRRCDVGDSAATCVGVLKDGSGVMYGSRDRLARLWRIGRASRDADASDFQWTILEIASTGRDKDSREDRRESVWSEPNPADDHTTIRFEVAEASRVRVTVYDVTGRGVAALLDEHVEVGPHHVSLNTASLAAGIYTVSLQSESVHTYRRLIVVH